jgi:plasmid stabilization system protein ParE
MSYQVEVTERAKLEIDCILGWLFDRSPAGAASWFEAWEQACVFLAENAHASSIAPESNDHEEEIRQWPFRTAHGHRYRALLIIRGNTVFITNVRGTGQPFVRRSDLGTTEA